MRLKYLLERFIKKLIFGEDMKKKTSKKKHELPILIMAINGIDNVSKVMEDAYANNINDINHILLRYSPPLYSAMVLTPTNEGKKIIKSIDEKLQNHEWKENSPTLDDINFCNTIMKMMSKGNPAATTLTCNKSHRKLIPGVYPIDTNEMSYELLAKGPVPEKINAYQLYIIGNMKKN